MSDNFLKIPEPDRIASPLIKKSRSISLIWLVPLVAALVGLGLAVKTIMEKGPTITINFSSAEGLEAGKTRIRFKDVNVGKVVAIQLDEQLNHVKVTAAMVPGMKAYLTESSRFWVVRAHIGAGEISGLGTLFSGAYIAMDPGKKGLEANNFKGLDNPPVVTMDTPGRYFRLRADKLGSLDIGAPVYFRQIKVGQVVHYEMQDDGQAVEVKIFIHSPHDKRVTQNTRFWNASGMDMALDSTGVRINTESILTLFEGGIAFTNLENLESGGPVDSEHHIFTLYPKFDQINEPTYIRKFHFIAYFDGTVRGLSKGAPVEFRGIKIGEVLDLKLQFNADDTSFKIPVLCAIEPDRIEIKGESRTSGQMKTDVTKMMDRLVRKGLRAQLRTGVLLTGQLFVNLDIHPDVVPVKMAFSGEYGQFCRSGTESIWTSGWNESGCSSQT